MRRLMSLMFCAAVVTTIACGDNDNTTEPSATIVGKWVGHYGGDEANETSDYTFFFRGDSTVGVIDGLGEEADIEAEGTWTVRGDTVFTDYAYTDGGAEYVTLGLLNKSRTQQKGIWNDAPNPVGGGTFTIKQQ